MKSTLEKLKRGGHVTIVALGDSITANTSHNRGYMNWVTLLDIGLHMVYGDESCVVINTGVPGASYRSVLQRLDRDVLRFAPDLVIVALGMNDGGRGLGGLPEFTKEVRQLIDTIQSKCGSDLLLMTPNPVVAETGQSWREDVQPGRITDLNLPLAAYSETLVKIAAEKQCVVIDHYQAWKNYRYPVDDLHEPYKSSEYQFALWPRMANSTHPGPLGHLAFYREIARVFELPRYFPWEER